MLKTLFSCILVANKDDWGCLGDLASCILKWLYLKRRKQYEMEIKEFVKKLMTSYNQFELKEENAYLKDILTIEKKHGDFKLSGDFLSDLYKKYEVGGRTIAFDFNKEIEEYMGFRFFAYQDPMNIGLEKESGNVVMYDKEWERIHYHLAPNLDVFLNIVLMIYAYALPGWFEDKKYTATDRKLLFSRIESIVGKDFLQYYNETYNF